MKSSVNNHDLASQMEALKTEVNNYKAMVTQLTKDKTQLQVTNNNLDKELKKASAIIAKDKNKQSIQQMIEENGKFKRQIEMLSEVSVQNEALRENIKHVGKINEDQKMEFDVKLAELLQKIEQLTRSSEASEEQKTLLAKYQFDLSALEQRIAQVNSEREQLNHELVHVRQELESVLKQKQREEETEKNKKNESKDVSTSNTSMNNLPNPEIMEMESKLSSVELALQNLTQERDHLINTQQKLQKEIQTKENELESSIQAVQKYTQLCQVLKYELESARTQSQILDLNYRAAISNLSIKNQDYETVVETLKQENQNLQNQLKNKEGQEDKLLKQIEVSVAYQTENEEKISNLSSENQQLKATIQSISDRTNATAANAEELNTLKEHNEILKITLRDSERLIEKMTLEFENNVLHLTEKVKARELQLAGQVEKLIVDVNFYKQDSEVSKAARSQIEDDMKEILLEKDLLTKELGRLESLCKSHEQKVADLAAHNTELSNITSKVTVTELSNLNKERMLEEMNTTWEAEKEELLQTIQTLQTQISNLKLAVRGRETSIKSLSVQVESLQKDLENSEEAKSSVIQTLELTSLSDSQAMADYTYQIQKLKSEVEKHITACFDKDREIKKLYEANENLVMEVDGFKSELEILKNESIQTTAVSAISNNLLQTISNKPSSSSKLVSSSDDNKHDNETIGELKEQILYLEQQLVSLKLELEGYARNNVRLQQDATALEWRLDEEQLFSGKQVETLKSQYIDEMARLQAEIAIYVANVEENQLFMNEVIGLNEKLSEELENATFQASDHQKIYLEKILKLNVNFEKEQEILHKKIEELKNANDDVVDQSSSIHSNQEGEIFKLKAEVENLTTQLMSSAANTNASQELEKLKEQFVGLKEELVCCQAEYEQKLKTVRETLELQVQEKSNQVSECETQIEKLNKQVQNLQGQLKEAETELRVQQYEQNAQNSVEQQENKIKLQEYQTKCHHLEVELLSLESKLEESQNIETGLKQQLEEAQSNIAQIDQQQSSKILIEEYELKIHEVKESLALAKSQFTQVQVSTSKQHAEEIKQLKANYELQLDQFKSQLQDLQQNLQTAQSTATGATASQSELENLEKRYKDLESMFRDSERQVEELQNVIVERSEKISQFEKSAAQHQKELETLKKKMAQDKEAHQILLMNLQEQIANMPTNNSSHLHAYSPSRGTSIGNLAGAADVDRLKKEKTELEETLKKEKVKHQTETDTYKKSIHSLEQSKSDQNKTFEKDMTSRLEEINKEKQKYKQLEADMQHLKNETNKLMQDMQKKSLAVEQESVAKIHSADAATKEKEGMTKEFESMKKQIADLDSERNLLNAELEVQKSSVERSSRSVAEKDDAIKKLRQKVEELQKNESFVKSGMSQLEKQVEDLKTQLKNIEDDHGSKESNLQAQLDDLKTAKSTLESQLEELKSELERAYVERDEAVHKMETIQKDMKTLEKKSNQMVKDLQKQLMKEKKHANNGEEHFSSNDHLSKINTDTMKRRATLSPQPLEPSQQPGVPKVEKLTDDLILLAHENEVLNKRVKFAEDELKVLTDRLNYLSEETEKKSKVIQQYALKEHAGKIIPDPPKLPGFNLSMLSGASSAQKLDPVMLSQINTKLQKLVEDLTSKVILMESELKSIKGTK